MEKMREKIFCFSNFTEYIIFKLKSEGTLIVVKNEIKKVLSVYAQNVLHSFFISAHKDA